MKNHEKKVDLLITAIAFAFTVGVWVYIGSIEL
jgi:hypothetical protein